MKLSLYVMTILLITAPYSATQAVVDYHRNVQSINGIHGPNKNQTAKRGAALNKNQNENQAQNAATATAIHNNNVNTQAAEQSATQAEINQNTAIIENRANEARSSIKSIIENRTTQSSQ